MACEHLCAALIRIDGLCQFHNISIPNTPIPRTEAEVRMLEEQIAYTMGILPLEEMATVDVECPLSRSSAAVSDLVENGLADDPEDVTLSQDDFASNTDEPESFGETEDEFDFVSCP